MFPFALLLWVSSAVVFDGVAPRVRVDAGEAKPTSGPPIEANAWRVRLLRARGAQAVRVNIPGAQLAANDALRAIADAAVAGGAWAGSPGASRHAAEYVSFFERHADWNGFAPAGPLGIVDDPAGAAQTLEEECLNILAQRRVPYRIVERADLAAPGALDGLKAVLAIGLAERRPLDEFAARGGIVLTDEEPDPDALVKKLVKLIGRAELGVRVFDTPSVLPYVSSGDSGKRLLVQLVNYASAPATRVTVRINGDYRAARLYTPDSPDTQLPLERPEGCVQVEIRSIPVYAAVLLEK
ncbi:MAG: hypothetical protein ACM336_01280 [Acidobacteriota bacterium]